MVKKCICLLIKYKIWFFVILIFNVLFFVYLWLLDAPGFGYLFPSFLLGSLLVYCFTVFIVYRTDKRKKEAVTAFLETPDLGQAELLHILSAEERKLVSLIGEKFRERDAHIKKQTANLDEYEAYVETWAHEIKAPLALLTVILDNRKNDLSAPIYERLEYIRVNMQEDIERMLYYTRVKTTHRDYIFTELSLKDICTDVLAEYRNTTEEQKIDIRNEVEDIKVFTDKNGLRFILRQLLSNAVKYKDKDAEKSFILLQSFIDSVTGTRILIIRDNGMGVKSYDLPFLFDKGFTGDGGQQEKHSTGMGLYLARQVGRSLKITITISEEYTTGLEIALAFPAV